MVEAMGGKVLIHPSAPENVKATMLLAWPSSCSPSAQLNRAQARATAKQTRPPSATPN